ncbi:tryptophan-rich sensory protein [Rhodocytophaga aerolata]|uniref:Tryptophan-rich sensory protein n=1 Tax=Rhodocytophaga aerolata TaxID=455078 RepID=A0ABT8R8K8_9BACT|nr:tryptophan-rich sensory protein [Rhodocytophaga aerolata]MDO1446995.1 tryptophan-rich sensory protein [Rhodocytophaga aerolata]
MNWTVVVSICIFYGILVIVNIPAPFIGLEFESGNKPRLWFEPPGFVIPVVWFILFTLMGIARYNLLQTSQAQYQWWLFALALLCASYAYYTLGLAKLTGISALWFGLAGNIVVIVFAAIVVSVLYPISKTAALLTLPVIVWTAFASLIILGEMKVEKLL